MAVRTNPWKDIHNMPYRTLFSRKLGLALALALVLMTLPCFAQSKVAPPGDTPATAGPLAHLSPRLSRRDVGKAMKLVADWQLNRLPAQPQTDWTFAALYTGYIAVPQKI